jgi:hypothetical protein
MTTNLNQHCPIGDREIKRTVTLDSKMLETPNLDIESGKGHGKEQKTVQ